MPKKEPSSPASALAETLSAARRTKGLTQDELASTLGVTQPCVSAWEAGRWSPSKANLGRLAAELDLDAADLLALEV